MTSHIRGIERDGSEDSKEGMERRSHKKEEVYYCLGVMEEWEVSSSQMLLWMSRKPTLLLLFVREKEAREKLSDIEAISFLLPSSNYAKKSGRRFTWNERFFSSSCRDVHSTGQYAQTFSLFTVFHLQVPFLLSLSLSLSLWVIECIKT